MSKYMVEILARTLVVVVFTFPMERNMEALQILKRKFSRYFNRTYLDHGWTVGVRFKFLLKFDETFPNENSVLK